MAQQREKEETGLKVPDAPSLCSPPIPTTSPPPKLVAGGDGTQTVPSSGHPDPIPSDDVRLSDKSNPTDERTDLDGDVSKKKRKREENVNRCLGCGKKVGLTGFRCRCGGLFCSEHRYSDRHSCSFDYKAAAREAIARQNPVVKAAKILKV